MQTKRDSYQVITDKIIDALETCGPSQRPWIGPNLTMPRNATSGHQYRGINVLMLWATAQEKGYAANRWATFKQWSDKGAKVRKGETGTPVVWFSMLDRKSDDAGDDEKSGRVPCLRLSWAFNVDQVEGYESEKIPSPADNEVSPIERADALIAASGAKIQHQGVRAMYVPSRDEIHMPPQHLFTGTATMTPTEAYYAVALHELTHWTGPRLDRAFGERFGDQAYAFEELVAELGAAFLCAELGVTSEPRDDHASYVASWIKVLKNDRKAIFTAASKAAEAADYLRGVDRSKIQEAA